MTTSQITLTVLACTMAIAAILNARACRKYRIQAEAAAERAQAAAKAARELRQEQFHVHLNGSPASLHVAEEVAKTIQRSSRQKGIRP